MRSMYFKTAILIFIMAFGFRLSAQFDDLYYDYKSDAVAYTKSNAADNKSFNNQNYNTSDSSYDDQEYGNYDEYSYTDRINRFSRSTVANDYYYNSFDDWWYNDNYYGNNYYNSRYFDNYYYPSYGSSINIYIGNSWGWNSWNRPWGWNSYYSGWNNWYSPWAFHSSYSPWGWNGYYGGNIINNYYYGDVYYGNGYYNGWNSYNNPSNNTGNTKNTIYGSRKSGAVSSSVNGREASHRKPGVSSDNNNGRNTMGAGDGLKQDNSDQSSSSIRVKNPADVRQAETPRTDNPNNNQRERIFNSDRNSSTDKVRINSSTDPNIRNNGTINPSRDNGRTYEQPSGNVRPDNNIRVNPPSQPSGTQRERVNEQRNNEPSRSMEGSNRSRPSNPMPARESAPSRSSGFESGSHMNMSRPSSGGSFGGGSSSGRSSQRGGR